MSTDKKLLVVLGASGVQGGGVIPAVLSQPTLAEQFNIRALSRNPTALAAKYSNIPNVSFAAADSDSLASLTAAFVGAHTVFGITNYWETRDVVRDTQQGKNIADACAANDVKHLIWSSMRRSEDVTEGEIVGAPGVDGKAAASQYMEELKKGKGLKVTHLFVGTYFSNLPRIWGYEDLDGRLDSKFPWKRDTTLVPFLDPAVDLGKFVAAVMVKGPEKMDGKEVQCVTEWVTMGTLCDVWEKLAKDAQGVRSKPMMYEEISQEEFEARLPEPLRAEQLGSVVKMIGKYELFGKGSSVKQTEDDALVKAAGLKKSSWEEYLRERFEADFADPMLPRFLFPYLVEQDRIKEERANGVAAAEDKREVVV